MKKFLSMLCLMVFAMGTAWAGLPLNAFPTGTTSFSNYDWGSDKTKNKVSYDAGNYIMMWSNGNNLTIDATGLKIGNSSKKSAFVFYVDAVSDISVEVARNGSDMAASLYYLGESTEELTDPNNMSPENALSSQDVNSSNSSATLSTEAGAAGYYMVFGTLRFYAKSITVTPSGPVTKTVTFVNDANWEKVFVWAWNNEENGETLMGMDWPGEELIPVEGVYTWSTTKSPTKIIFSDNGSVTNRIEADFKDGSSYNSKGRIIVLNDYTATLTTDMEAAYAYVWRGNGDSKVEALGEWPGTKLTATNGTYSVAIQAEEAPEHIIFHNNAGVQTQDLDFEDGKAYEFMKQDFTVTFKTDAGWDKVYAWTWTGNTNYAGEWPGVELTAEDGVYTYTYNGYYAPEKILFNGGDNSKKTADMAFVNGKAYKYITATPLFAIQAGTTYTYGQTVEVKDAGEVVATITFGNEGEEGADFKETTTNTIEGYIGYMAQTNGGNNANGNASTGGTTYTIKPVYDGQLSIAVKVGGGKKFHLLEDGEAVAPHDGFTPKETYIGTLEFAVKGGKAYKFYCDGSKLDIFGFDYTFDKHAVQITSMAIVGDFLGKDTEEENFNPANGWAMTQDTENPAIWTLTQEDVAIEGKQYDYKATANGVYGEYELPNKGNQNWVFGTPDYPAGIYDITFTVDTQSHQLTLDPVLKAVTLAPAKELSTYSIKYALNFSAVEGLEAYVVSEIDGSAAKLNKVEKAPAGTGLILRKTGDAAQFSIPTATDAPAVENLLTGTGSYDYRLTAGEAYLLKDGKFGLCTEGTLAPNKAFLPVGQSSASILNLVFGGETTGIKAIGRFDNLQSDNCYDLSGRQVVKPANGQMAKGLYIVNGKKVVIK